jgi:hypothetical protein
MENGPERLVVIPFSPGHNKRLPALKTGGLYKTGRKQSRAVL